MYSWWHVGMRLNALWESNLSFFKSFFLCNQPILHGLQEEMCYVGSPFRGALGLWKGRFDGEEAAVIQHVLTPARTDALISVQVFRWGQDPSASTVLSFQTFTPDPRKSSGALISTSFADAEDSSAESELSLQPTHRESCCPWTAKFPNAPVMSEMCRRAGKHRVGNIKIDKK